MMPESEKVSETQNIFARRPFTLIAIFPTAGSQFKEWKSTLKLLLLADVFVLFSAFFGV